MLFKFLDIVEELRKTFPRNCRGNFLDIVEKLINTRCPDSSQPEMKPDWYQRVSIDHFHWTIAGPTNWLVWAKKNFSTLSRNCEKHFLEIVEELTLEEFSSWTRAPRFSSTRTVRTRQSTLLQSVLSHCEFFALCVFLSHINFYLGENGRDRGIRDPGIANTSLHWSSVAIAIPGSRPLGGNPAIFRQSRIPRDWRRPNLGISGLQK